MPPAPVMFESRFKVPPGLETVKPVVPPLVVIGVVRVSAPELVNVSPARLAASLWPLKMRTLAPPSRAMESTLTCPPLTVIGPAIELPVPESVSAPCPLFTSEPAVIVPASVSALGVTAPIVPMTLTIPSPAPPAPKLTGAEMVAAATLEASAPLAMVSAFTPPIVCPVVAKKTALTVAGADGSVTAPVMRMLSVGAAVVKLLPVLYSVVVLSKRTPLPS